MMSNSREPTANSLDPSSESIAPAEPFSSVPENVRPLLGPSWIIEGEDPKLYEELLARVAAAVRPRDILEWLLVKDVVALTWDIQRSRRHRESIMRGARFLSVRQLLTQIMPNKEYGFHASPEDSPAGLSSAWLGGDKKAGKRIEGLFAQAGFSMADVEGKSLTNQAVELDRIDQQNERHEGRRDKLLQQIDRRRDGWANLVKRQSDEIVEGHFRELPPDASDGQSSGAASGSDKR